MITEELENMKKEVNSVKKIKEELLYMNLISLIRNIIIMWVISILLIIGGLFLFLSQYDFVSEETSYEQQADTEGDNSPINQNIGGNING